MTAPTDAQLAALEGSFEAFSRRYKLAEALGGEQQLNELDKQALLYLLRNAGCGPTDLARFLAVPNTTVSSATDRLVKRGLLERRRPEHDRRAVELHLTAAGRGRAEGLLAAFRALYRQMLAPLSAAERETLIVLMAKIVSNED